MNKNKHLLLWSSLGSVQLTLGVAIRAASICRRSGEDMKRLVWKGARRVAPVAEEAKRDHPAPDN